MYGVILMKKKLKDFLLPIIPALVMLILVMAEPFYNADAFLCDMAYLDLQGSSQDIVIIGIDEETLGAYGNFSNWSREKSAQLVEFLCENEETKPALIGFDIMFIGESTVDPKSDEK